MPDMTAPIKLGANCWNQYTDWASWLSAQQRAERLGYDSLWTWDHLYPIVGSWQGPILEAYTAISALAATTERATLGLMVGANTFRNPALVAKMMTTIDHISGGRAMLGIGAAWFETEHTGFGIDFGDGRAGATALAGPGAAHHARHARRQRADRDRGHLPDARGAQRPATGPAAPAHPHRGQRPPGDAQAGGAVRRCLQPGWSHRCSCRRRRRPSSSTARSSDATSVRSSAPSASACQSSATPVRRPTRVHADIFRRNGDARVWEDQPVGTPEDVVERLTPLVGAGLPPYHLWLPIPLRRGDDDPAGHRGPSEAGGDRRRRIEDAAGQGRTPVRQRIDLGDVPGHVGRSPVAADSTQAPLSRAYAATSPLPISPR